MAGLPARPLLGPRRLRRRWRRTAQEMQWIPACTNYTTVVRERVQTIEATMKQFHRQREPFQRFRVACAEREWSAQVRIRPVGAGPGPDHSLACLRFNAALLLVRRE